MDDKKRFSAKDLILQVTQNYDKSKLKLNEWDDFIEVLCQDREYQKEAIKQAVIYLFSGEYRNIEDLIGNNFSKNPELQNRYRDLSEYENKLQIPRKLSGVIDLATGTGKSYVIYGIAQIALGLGLVDKVLVLCPSLTIEDGLKDKFMNLAGDDRVKSSLPENAVIKNPRIVDANQTIEKGDIAVENIHAVYAKTGSSIEDSFKSKGEKVLVLSDEVHHAYNSNTDRDIKKWKEFLLNPDYGFKYILGFTGTAYIADEYFNDVIYRYSIRQAIDDRIVKSVEYVAKDDSIGEDDKFQKVYDNHKEFVNKYPEIKPLTIFVARDIKKAKQKFAELVDFLVEKEKLSIEQAEEKVLIVTSHKDHKANLIHLKTVDDKSNSYEWIVSVSMLTEGWDVKNVFQIVPCEERAFNSKLLIAQVLGRGLRLPPQYPTPQPKVRVFNHDSWSRNIKGLVDEILEIEIRLQSKTFSSGDREKYNFDLYGINYEKEEKSVPAKEKTKEIDFLKKGYINLLAQSEELKEETEYEDFLGNLNRKETVIKRRTQSIDEVVAKIMEAFATRKFEAKVRFPNDKTYESENPPPKEEIKAIVEASMEKVGITSGRLVDENAHRVFSAFQMFFRPQSASAVIKRKSLKPYKISTQSLDRSTLGVGSLRQGSTVFYSSDFESELDTEILKILQEVINDDSLPKSAEREVNKYNFKTPLSLVFTDKEPEKSFVNLLTSDDVSQKIDAWIKSRDIGFYTIQYTWKKGTHHTEKGFNPDFFIRSGENVIVIEIKADGDDSDENKAKSKWAKDYFSDLNRELEQTGMKQKYFFHFLSPKDYKVFADYLIDGRLFEGKFKSELDDLLEQDD